MQYIFDIFTNLYNYTFASQELSEEIMPFYPPEVTAETKATFNFPLVELHVHFDGSIRIETIWELAQTKNIEIEGVKSSSDLKNLLITHKPDDLAGVLKAFDIFLPIVRGDLDAIERIAYEMVEDQAKNNVCYFEARYSPQFFSDKTEYNLPLPPNYGPRKEISCEQIVEAANRGFKKGENEFGVVVRSILCCIRGFEKWAKEVLDLVVKYQKEGVVAMDVAGSSGGADEQYSEEVTHVFQKAHDLGIFTTAHAGEAGTYKEVKNVVENLKVHRVGHGYHILDDEDTYKKIALQDRIHLEACPYSSIMTGACDKVWQNHPTIRWSKDDANFSLSTDDPTCFGNCIQSDLIIAKDYINLSVHQIWKCQLNAIQSCFLLEEDKDIREKLTAEIKAAEPK
uniref:Adenosine deaminase n=1 Tax=Parastrongyloides trichosuri TaxID=131310 RepID=A0A0N5A465_PARTI